MVFTLITIGSRVAETPPTIDKAIKQINVRVVDMFQEETAMLGKSRND
jgi:hypothetical protein